MRRALIVVGAVSVVLSGCTQMTEGVTRAQRVAGLAPPPTTRPKSPSLPNRPAVGAPATTAQPVDTGLAALLVTDLPAGFVRQPEEVGRTGPLDLAGAVDRQGGPGIEAVLRASGYVRGYQRRWTDGGFPFQDILVVLHQHATPEGAQRHLEGYLPFTSMSPSPETPLVVAGLPAAAHGASTMVGDRASVVIVFRTGSFVVEVDGNGGTAEQARGRAAAIALDQLRRLPG